MDAAGGGGYGDPLERDPSLVERDVAEGYVTTTQAREQYGVVVDAETLASDWAATNELRKQRERTHGE